MNFPKHAGRDFLSVILIIAPSVICAIFNKATLITPFTLAGALAAAFVNLSRLESFKGAGFEAKIREADTTIAALREIARPLILTSMDVITMAGRMGGMDGPQKHAFLGDLNKAAKDIGLGESREISEANKKFFRHHCWDHFDLFLFPISKDDRFSKETRDKLKELHDRQSIDFPSRSKIVEILDKGGEKLSEEQRERLENYLYYVETKELRVPAALKG